LFRPITGIFFFKFDEKYEVDIYKIIAPFISRVIYFVHDYI